MKTVIIFLMLSGTLFSCDKTNNKIEAQLIGKWQLIEILADPGDGSGTFRAVDSDKTVEFYNDGTITSNGSLCEMSIQVGSKTSGTYSISDSTINSVDCVKFPFEIRYEITGNELIINYPCIEPCRAKFKKTE